MSVLLKWTLLSLTTAPVGDGGTCFRPHKLRCGVLSVWAASVDSLQGLRGRRSRQCQISTIWAGAEARRRANPRGLSRVFAVNIQSLSRPAKREFATARKIVRLLSRTRCRLPRAARPHGETFNFDINRIWCWSGAEDWWEENILQVSVWAFDSSLDNSKKILITFYHMYFFCSELTGKVWHSLVLMAAHWKLKLQL